jgi:hypothetical protein
MASKSSQIRPTEPNQMPWIVITCGNKENDPHGLSWVAEFFDSRFPSAGYAYPRNDMPQIATQDFSWDCYRQDIGKVQLLPPLKPGDDPVSAREHKSALRNWDTPDGFYIECRQPVMTEKLYGISTSQCKKRTHIRREDWNEFGKVLLESKTLVEGAKPYLISWSFLMRQIHAIQGRNKTNSQE